MCSLQSSFCSPTSIHGLGIKTRGPAPRVDCSVVTVRGLRAHRDNRRPDGGSSRLRRGPAGEPALTRLRYLRCADEQAPTRTERGILTDSARGQWAPAHLPATAQTGQTYATVSYVRPVCAVAGTSHMSAQGIKGRPALQCRNVACDTAILACPAQTGQTCDAGMRRWRLAARVRGRLRTWQLPDSAACEATRAQPQLRRGRARGARTPTRTA